MKDNNIRIKEIKTISEAKDIIKQISGDYREIKENFEKVLFRTIQATDLNARAANLLKQIALEEGMDVIISKDVTLFNSTTSDVLLMGTLKNYEKLYYNLKTKEFGLSSFAEEVRELLLKYDNELQAIKIGNYKLDFHKKTFVMGILNITPDSFSDGGNYNDIELAVKRAKEMEAKGADIIDIGAESSRPGAEPVSATNEIKRLSKIVDRILEEVNIPVSIDTYKSEVAKAMLEKGVHIINDITGLQGDEKMAEVIADYDAVVIAMHMQGTPESMQINPEYNEVIADIIEELKTSVRIAKVAGIRSDKIILDPGIGFGKTLNHNLKILNKLNEFKTLGLPILIGGSRKSFIKEISGKDVNDRLNESIASAIIASQKGANIVRVHDVKETVEAMKISDAIDRVNDD
ncbi:MAG: dihydropteroate synthase [Fusobacteriota bacterium]